MNKVLLVAVLSSLTVQLFADARFTGFSYVGEDVLKPCDPMTEYRNPILGGMAPDPAITRKGEDFYLANSSFSYYPGIPVFHSRNLTNWDFCGYVGDTVAKLRLPDGVGLSAGVFAPDIKYNPHNDTFYLIVTVIGDRGNVIYKSKDPYQGWGEPIKVPVGGIDPSIFFEDDKTAWILNNDDAPGGKAEYPGHRTVRMRKYDLVKDECVPGTERIIINKGVRPQDKPIWCEGPHLYKIDGRYWVMTAEGGTGGWHSEVMWVADNVEGPYTPCKINPILTQRDLPHDRPAPITAAGHADLFQTPGGDWMAIFLAIEPYRRANGQLASNSGRNTYLLPVKWVGEGKDRQPVILEKGKIVERVLPKTAWMKTVSRRSDVLVASDEKVDRPIPEATGTSLLRLSGNVAYRDDFTSSALDWSWFAERGPATFAKTGADGLRLTPTGKTLNDAGTPAYLCRWVRNNNFTTQITCDFDPAKDGAFAGLAAFQNEKCYYAIGLTLQDGQPVVALRKADKGTVSLVATAPAPNGPVQLRYTMKGAEIAFCWSSDGKDWHELGGKQDSFLLSTDYGGGFVATTIGPFVE